MLRVSRRLMSMVDETRISRLNDEDVRGNGKFVLYWMQESVRSRYNHALEYAVERANEVKVPLLAVYGVDESFPETNERHKAFLLEGLAEAQKNLGRRGIKLLIVNHPPKETVSKLQKDAACVVVDRGYVRIVREWRQEVAEASTCAVFQVETDVVVPVEVTSNKEETAARTIRKKIEGRLDTYLKKVQEVPLEHDSPENVDLHGLQLLDISDIESALASLSLDCSVWRVKTFLGGEDQASKQLQLFLDTRLKHYGKRNEPSVDITSNMSPYLHYGNISPIEIALKVRPLRKKYPDEVKSFLEELIVRRELAFNLVFYNDAYDSFDVIPNYAKITLMEHADDKRPYLYTEEQLERAMTHDIYWNAAQAEMVLTGKMHTYMRMYWGKKILEWTSGPREAFDIALRLNNKYNIDGRDPNSFTGIAWCFGKHDQGWAEREIFGKVRYMNSAGLERKFDMKGYVRRINKIRSGHEGWENPPGLLKYFNKRSADLNGLSKPSKRRNNKRSGLPF
ncbi:hypothetical protein NDN08_001415 [Rhodosorus marinus]|uniref:Deoxyribodipyrimidine photo-lyase n=1 Tax=Rhodosorus marinus TaxID=101924 RepID=A0AAV8UWK4_9RHOD|nr:hypothetical protein NDN08_001415 [Rhodosorus marinus]